MSVIHETSIIYPDVKIGHQVVIEPLCVIGQSSAEEHKDVVIGDFCHIGTLTQIHAGAILDKGIKCLGGDFIAADNIIGEGTRIGPEAVLRHGNRIGKHVRIHSHVFLERVVLLDHVFVGPHVVFTDDPHPPCPDSFRCVSETIVEQHVSIGANSTIGPGLRIGRNSLIYAGSVIVKDVEPDSVMAGNPAKRIKDVKDLVCAPAYHSRPYAWLPDKV